MRRAEEPEDDVVVQIREGIRLRESGDKTASRAVFDRVWRPLGDGGDPFHRMFVAHSMADAQDDRRQELEWDLIALEAFDEFTEERAAERGIPGGRNGVAPSLHLNLAQDYAGLDEIEAARRHLALAERCLDVLADDEYGRQVRQCFDELATVLRTSASCDAGSVT